MRYDLKRGDKHIQTFYAPDDVRPKSIRDEYNYGRSEAAYFLYAVVEDRDGNVVAETQIS